MSKKRDSTPHVNPLYRGTGRSGPSYEDAFSNSALEPLFRWYMDESVHGPLHDLVATQRFVELLHQFYPEKRYELIEIINETASPSVGATFLGFDVIEGYGNSLIQWGLKTSASKSEVHMPIRHFNELINFTFAPLLNNQGLSR